MTFAKKFPQSSSGARDYEWGFTDRSRRNSVFALCCFLQGFSTFFLSSQTVSEKCSGMRCVADIKFISATHMCGRCCLRTQSSYPVTQYVPQVRVAATCMRKERPRYANAFASRPMHCQRRPHSWSRTVDGPNMEHRAHCQPLPQ